MASLLIRNVPEAVRRALRVRAARQGRSMEAEVRAILAHAIQGESPDFRDLQRYIAAHLPPGQGSQVDTLLRERREEARSEERATRRMLRRLKR